MELPPRLDVFSTRTASINGEERTLRTRVGAAFRHRNGDGYNIVINENIAVANELVLFPPEDRDADRPPSRTRSAPRRTAQPPAPAPVQQPRDDGWDPDDIPF